jgi:pimeloyl-ACP methyl ester carboxylesterase/class 3 adenylate cyclase
LSSGRGWLKLPGVERPTTHYAKSGDASVAYQVVGEGPFDIVFVPGFVSHVELRWTVPSFAANLNQLASFSRLILFDKRGTGMSDRVAGAPTLETRMDDLRAVMDAVGCRRAALFGVSEGAPMSLLFAATYPERTAALVLRSGFPRTMWAPDYPWGRTEEQYQRDLEHELRIYGARSEAEDLVRSLASWEERDVAAIVDYLRWCASPGALEALVLMNKQIDVRHVLPAIRVPTLILHGSDDTVIPIDVARYTAERVPGALLVEVPGAGHLHFGRYTAVVQSEVQHFLAQLWEEGGWEESEPDRVLATVLFTDIVGASKHASELGDRAWRELLERHHALVRRQLVRFRGTEVDTAGDGFFASFDGPARAIHCASAIVEAVAELGLQLRGGLHTGECELVDGKVAGIAVYTGARVAAFARPGELLVSSTVKDLVAGSGIRFQDRGSHELKGIPGEWRLYAAATWAEQAPRSARRLLISPTFSWIHPLFVTFFER